MNEKNHCDVAGCNSPAPDINNGNIINAVESANSEEIGNGDSLGDYNCQDFLPVLPAAASAAGHNSPCDSCGNHDCQKRQITAESLDAADRLGASRLVQWSFAIFILPLICACLGANGIGWLCNSSETNLVVLGAVSGFALGVFFAWAGAKVLLKDNK